MTYGDGVRAQVFEVIVRQAIAGAPWQEICAGPMAVNNITPEEVEREVEHRLNFGREILSEAQKELLAEYLSAWEESVQPGKTTAMATIEQAVANFYKLFNLKCPRVILCESPAKLAFYLSRQASKTLSGEDDVKAIAKMLCAHQEQEFADSLDQAEEMPDAFGKALLDRIQNDFQSFSDAVKNKISYGMDSNLATYFRIGFHTKINRFILRPGTIFDVTESALPLELFAVDNSERRDVPAELGQMFEQITGGEPGVLGRLREQTIENFRRAFAATPPVQPTVVRSQVIGIWRRADLIAYGFMQRHLSSMVKLTEPLGTTTTVLLTLYEAAPWYSFFENVCFVGMNPQSVFFDDTFRLSNTDGPALTFADGYRVYSVEGIVCPRKFVEDPQSIVLDDIDQIENVALRRMYIETYGVARYLQDSGAELIHKDECGELYRKEIENDEPLAMVCVTNSTMEPDGSYKRYFLRVPPQIETAREAVAWTFGIAPADYKPDQET